VLPFVDMSQGHDQEYFSDGISEELLNLLSQVPQLRVIARTSSFSFKGRSADAAQIAHALQVAHLLEGSVRKSGDTLRITVQLVRASDSSHLWSQTYDRRLTDVFKVQDEIAAAVVSELKIKLLGAAPRSREVDPGAYTLYLEALEIGRKGSADALEQSNRLYQQALAIDSNYAAAWEGLAGNYCEQVQAWQRPPAEGFRMAREATAKALQLDPEFAPAHARLGWLALYEDRDLAAAAGHLERALTMAPTDPGIIEGAGNLVRRLGRLDQALALNRYLVSRDPLNPSAHDYLAATYMDSGRWDDAIAELRTVLALSPGYLAMHALIGEMLLHKGDARGALAEMEKEPDENSRLVGLVMAYAALGRKAESDAALAELIRKYEQTSAYNIAFVLAFRRENDRAFEWLDKAVRYHDPSVGSIAGYPMFGRLESDPRWLPFLRSIGVAPEQLAAVQFDVKIPQ
jgi:TolB-like protein/Flp pilus assembly protein TadD